MNKEEFKKYVMSEAKKYLFSTEQAAPEVKPISESVEKPSTEKVNASDIKRLAEEMKKINKKIDLRNPLISESEEGIVDTIMNESNALRDRELDVDSINQHKNLNHQNEAEKDKWSRMLDYKKFSEDDEK